MTRRWLARTLWLLLGWAWLAGAALAEPAPGEVPAELSLWRDAQGDASIDAVAQQRFAPVRNPLSLGSLGGVAWVRVVLPPLAGHDGDWALLFKPTMLQDAVVFVPAAGGGWQTVPVGNRHAFADRPIRTLNAAVPLPASAGPQTVYVRLRTASWALSLQVLPIAVVHENDSRLQAAVGLYMGMATVAMLISLLSWLLTRDRLWGMNAAFDLATLLQTSTQLGFTSRYLLPHADDLVNLLQVLINCSHIAMAMGFYALLFRRFASRRWASWPFLAALLSYPLQLWWIAQGEYAIAQTVCNATLLFISVAGLGLSWLFDTPDRLLRWLLRGLNVLLVSYLIYFMLPAFVTDMPLSDWHFYPSIPSNVITVLIVLSALARATQLQVLASRRDAEQRLLAEQQLALERRQHDETSGMLGMLMHEIRTPLSLIQTGTRAIRSGRASGTAGLQQAVHRIDEQVLNVSRVLERCAETDQLDRGHFHTVASEVDAAAHLRAWLAERLPQGGGLRWTLPYACRVRLDLHLWLQMAGNLIDNALKYSVPDAPIDLELSWQQGLLRLVVSNAPGEAGHPDPARLFGKYYRADRAATVSGTGLGLYWVKQISHRLGGDVRCLSPRDAGPDDRVVFVLEVPAPPA